MIYSCYYGCYFAVVAASLHLGYINIDEYNKNDILRLQLFNKIRDNELGKLFYLGIDNEGREVHVIGSRKSGKILEKTFKGIVEIYGFPKESVFFIDLNDCYSNLTLLGILMVRRLGLVEVGMRLVLRGIGNNFCKLKETVQKVRLCRFVKRDKLEVNR